MFPGEDGKDADDTERGERRTDGAVLRRPAGLLLGGGMARRSTALRCGHMALLRLGSSQATRLRYAQCQLPARLPRGHVHVGDEVLPPARVHHHHHVHAGQEEPRRRCRHHPVAFRPVLVPPRPVPPRLSSTPSSSTPS